MAESKHALLASNRGMALYAIKSDIEMADDILCAVQEHFSKPHPDVKHCDCDNKLRVARKLIRVALDHARSGN